MPQPKDKTKVQDWKDNISKKLKGRRCCMRTEFKRGRKSWNFGTKGLTHRNKTSFKKGQMPVNFMGYYKVCKDGIYVKTTKGKYSYMRNGKQIRVGKYENLARIKYREAFGDFDKKLLIFHKDGDIFNNEIENLELISRKENLRRNMYKTTKICVICGTQFKCRVLKQKNCSKECSKEYKKEYDKEKNISKKQSNINTYQYTTQLPQSLNTY